MKQLCCIFFTGLLFTACHSDGEKEKKGSAAGSLQTRNETVSASDTVSAAAIIITDLPAGLLAQVKGKAILARRWTDKTGENIIVLAEGTENKHPKPIGNDIDQNGKETPFYAYYKELYAAQFVKTDTGYKAVWKLSDRMEDCELDMTAAFIKEALSVTDLNKNGIAETTVQYKLACRSDVSPAYMKLIMHEDKVKYALRGSMWIKDSEEAKFTVTKSDVNLSALPGYKGNENDWYKAYGRYENEKGFTGAPAVFLDYARQRWLQFAVESFE